MAWDYGCHGNFTSKKFSIDNRHVKSGVYCGNSELNACLRERDERVLSR